MGSCAKGPPLNSYVSPFVGVVFWLKVFNPVVVLKTMTRIEREENSKKKKDALMFRCLYFLLLLVNVLRIRSSKADPFRLIILYYNSTEAVTVC